VRIACVLLLAGCYSPSARPGAPCNPDSPHCPTGQTCGLRNGEFVCGTGDIDPPDASPDAPPVTVTYVATVAECIDPTNPNPATCRSIKGNTQLVVDGKDATTADPWDAFIRFDLDDALQGRIITRVRLRLTSTNDSLAPGPDTGTPYHVSSFTLQSLSMKVPTKLGSMSLAASQGPVTASTSYDFELDAALAAPSSPVFIGLFPNAMDGVNYWNADGTVPPALVVDAD
jgi:hypothetical protein